MNKSKFQRTGPVRNPKKDETGVIYIMIDKRISGKHDANNISMSMSVKEAKVSDIFAAIEQALFGEEN